MTSSMNAAIHLGPKYLSNSEIYKNTKFEDIESLFNIVQKLLMEHFEEILNENGWNIHHFPGRDQYYYPMTKRSNGRRQKYVSMLIPFHVWDR